MPEPKRIRLSRRRGWRKPPGTAVVSRPSRWGNPFIVLPGDGCWTVVDRAGIAERHERPNRFGDKEEARAWAVELYQLHTGPMGSYELDVDEVRRELAGKDLACWCPLADEEGRPVPCHADVLLAVANGWEVAG